jgi:hypothetical protein
VCPWLCVTLWLLESVIISPPYCVEYVLCSVRTEYSECCVQIIDYLMGFTQIIKVRTVVNVVTVGGITYDDVVSELKHKVVRD